MIPFFTPFLQFQIVWPLPLVAAQPLTILAGPDSSISFFSAALVTLVGAATTGCLVWLAGRRARKETEVRAAGTVQQISSLIEHADCLLWEARVDVHGAEWKWEFTLHSSVLSRKLFGGKLPDRNLGLWYKFKIPQQAEMDRTSREAMEKGRPGYEQQFQVEFEGRMMWLRESVSITALGSGRFRLVGLATDITAQHEAEVTNLASQERLQQLLVHANCMIWQADVTRNAAGEFDWEWFVPRSELHRRMMG